MQGKLNSFLLNELKKQFPRPIAGSVRVKYNSKVLKTDGVWNANLCKSMDNNNRDSKHSSYRYLYFNYKTYMNEVYKVKETATGATKIIAK